ncbi:hypothetical protein BD311DRAFT_756175 [Dichomitus squalens]|uniref:Uncharacterized protein n=1 Tax=Dichomitus squalens TaxID=114155 RepID=A0A4Q9MU03_9APHY|nr:hypothetical protein BD311DRAFT_756175 [Dichomitus squalens]
MCSLPLSCNLPTYIRGALAKVCIKHVDRRVLELACYDGVLSNISFMYLARSHR